MRPMPSEQCPVCGHWSTPRWVAFVGTALGALVLALVGALVVWLLVLVVGEI